ncbi:hypothetical protein K2173_010031 [Erythroxylum novogranatense]|uniref:Protein DETOXIFICATION n=1 Tax=Erythroxylum novogranatense TaxID=1862640 RepID=A0AAV8TWE1_9ROSI|nr:hypothetical protein K2173_014413 [Erythroxylum novogranatense]KAJ8770043.1 hypothetical protein K2173_010031 [Erythroxylum novogranatense]
MGDHTKSMQEGLLVKEQPDGLIREALMPEVKRVCYIAGPMVAVTLSQYLLQVICMMMVGHLDELSLSSTAIAISLSSVSGYTVLLGMASALETLCGQAYGAQQYQKLGVETNTAIFCLLSFSVPLSVLWIFMGKILVLIGQDPAISYEAGKFLACLTPGLFGHAVLQPLIRYYQVQSLVIPMLVASGVTLCIHVPLCWALVNMTDLGNIGAAFALCISIWLNVTFLGVYMKFSFVCAKTRMPFTREAFGGVWKFFRFAIPSAIMICLEGWSFELLVLLSGLLPNPELEASVLSVCLTTITTIYSVPNGLGAAVSTRVSNELGAGNPQGARIAVYTVMSLTIIESLVLSSALFATRSVFGYTFSNEKEVVNYVTRMAPLVCVSVFLDGLLGAFSGIARGCGWQHIGAYINLGAYYLLGVPAAAILAFPLKLRGYGLWIGIQLGAFVQIILLSIVTGCTNWEKQANKARKRIFEETSEVDKVLV